MDEFFDRLRRALAPDYELVQELGRGGMGTVYLARHVALASPIAVKVLRPEHATSTAVERFVREAHVLANLHNPFIVTVHDRDVRDGLHFYTMDYLEGDSLERRLAENGALGTGAARKIGRDLLEALEIAHRHGVIHRDVKPANVFLVGRRAVLTDFGIARQVDRAQLTDPRNVLGTVVYMAPEQLAGVEANEQTDIYSAGMVIYEALTGRRWLKGAEREGDWSQMPRRVAKVLRRAVALDPAARWPDAASFRRALWRTPVSVYIRNAIGLAVSGVVLGFLADRAWIGLAPHSQPGFAIRVDAASVPAGLGGWLADSVACGFARRLDGYPDLRAHCASGLGRFMARGLPIRPRLERAGEGALRIRLESDVVELDTIVAAGRTDAWPALADSLAQRAFAALLGTRHLLERSLPTAVLPKTPAGLFAFAQAEQLFARGRWGAARAAYGAAAALDSTCWLCFWRHAEVGRWSEDVEDDPRDSTRYLAHAGAFPPYYQSLMRAERLPEGARIDSLDALTERWHSFLFGQFRKGDELVHRGPLVGRSRRLALEPFEETLRRQPAFGPALQHLAWLDIAEGDSAAAARTLARLEQLGEPIDSTSAAAALVELAFGWRFLAPPAAMARTEALISAARAAGFAAQDAGARYLPAFGAPAGALAVSERLLREPAYERSASLGRVLALLGEGRPDTAIVLARLLARQFAELQVFADELVAVLLALDADSARAAATWSTAERALAADADLAAGSAARRRRAQWMVGVVEALRPAESDIPTRRAPLVGEEPPHPLATFLKAVALATEGGYAAALATTAGLVEIPVAKTADPFFRTVLHLSRAEWSERIGDVAKARAELTWWENSDVLGYPTGDPQPAELDWAFGALGAWRLARLNEGTDGPRDETCRAYAAVVRAWSQGEPRYRARADSAVRRRSALACRDVR